MRGERRLQEYMPVKWPPGTDLGAGPITGSDGQWSVITRGHRGIALVEGPTALFELVPFRRFNEVNQDQGLTQQVRGRRGQKYPAGKVIPLDPEMEYRVRPYHFPGQRILTQPASSAAAAMVSMQSTFLLDPECDVVPLIFATWQVQMPAGGAAGFIADIPMLGLRWVQFHCRLVTPHSTGNVIFSVRGYGETPDGSINSDDFVDDALLTLAAAGRTRGVIGSFDWTTETDFDGHVSGDWPRAILYEDSTGSTGATAVAQITLIGRPDVGLRC